MGHGWECSTKRGHWAHGEHKRETASLLPNKEEWQFFLVRSIFLFINRL